MCIIIIQSNIFIYKVYFDDEIAFLEMLENNPDNAEIQKLYAYDIRLMWCLTDFQSK